MSVTAFLVALFAVAVVPTEAWWCYGHMLVAMVAKQHLNSGVYDKVNTIINDLSTTGVFPLIPSMVPAACWADDLKAHISVMEGWHFANIPYNPDNMVVPAMQYDNVEHVLFSLEGTIHHGASIMWEKSFALANVIHFMGDIHQPLHVTELFDSNFPNGDLGGNLFMINFQGNTTDLHGVWDSIGGLYSTDPRPLNSSSEAAMEALATRIVAQYPFNSSMTSCYNTTTMAQEGYELAIEYAYLNHRLQPGDTLNATYIANCIQTAEMRIALGGQRLANELNYLFGSYEDPTAEQLKTRLKELHRGRDLAAAMARR